MPVQQLTKSIVIRSWIVQATTDFMLRSWAAKVTAMLGGPDLGKYESSTGYRNSSGDWIRDRRKLTPGSESEYGDVWDEKIPTWTGDDSATTPLQRGMLHRGLMHGENAQAVLQGAAVDALANLEATTKVQRGVRPYRKWQAVQNARKIMAKELEFAILELRLRALTKKKREGVQRISTSRKRSSLPIEQSFQFGGSSARRARPGRPALSSAAWLARYRSRAARRRASNKTKRTTNRGTVRVPEARFGRPST